MALFLLTLILFVPLLTGVIACWENRRAGQLARQRALCNGHLALGLASAFLNSVWTLWLTMLALPFGSLPQSGCSRGTGSLNRPPVLLVHGLYHNPAAWFVMRRRLARAGFTDVRCYGYPSFGKEFAAIAGALAQDMAEAARSAPGGRILLLGHSLGGLVIRAACADERVVAGCVVAGVVSLGTPHLGSTLAGILGQGRLARGLRPGGEVLRFVQALPAPRVPWLSLYTPTDGMVLPLGNAFLDAGARAAGWQERALPPLSHVGLLYSGVAAQEAVEFFAQQGAKSEAAA